MKANPFLQALFLVLCLSQSTVLRAGPKEVQLRWDDLAPLIVGEEVSLELPGAIRIGGKIIAVTPDALETEIKKTSNRQVYAQGQALVPRSSVTVIEMRKMRGSRWRIIGTITGVVGGGVVGLFLADRFAVERKLLVHIGTMAGATAFGYSVGHVADREVTIIRIVPETTSPTIANP